MSSQPSEPSWLVSPSQFRVHKNCSEQHYYTYGLNLRNKLGERKFEVGSYWHELAHYYYQLLQSGYKVGDVHTVAAMDTKMKADLSIVSIDFVGVLAQVHIMFRRFLDRRTSDIDSGITILEVEKELKVKCLDDVYIHGILDLLYRKKDGKLVVRDHKTGENKGVHSNKSLETNDQLLTYACMAYFIYNEVPDIEISWINSKVDYKGFASNEQLFNLPYRKLTKEIIETFWTYVQEYVYHMQTVPKIRAMTDFKCGQCQFVDPCMMSLRGIDVRDLLRANYKEVPRNYDYLKFTEIARKKPSNTPAYRPPEISSDSSGGIQFPSFDFTELFSK